MFCYFQKCDKKVIVMFILIIGILFLLLGVSVYIHKKKSTSRLVTVFRLCIIASGILFLLLSLVLFGMGARMYERNPVGRLRATLPQIREDFTMAQSRFDTLRGEFARHSASIWVPSEYILMYGWRISYNASPYRTSEDRVSVYFSDWHEIEWLSQEAKDAIIFLVSSQDIGFNFNSIFTEWTTNDDMHHIYATINYELRDAELMIFYSPHRRLQTGRFVHHEDIGEGYMLTIEHFTLGRVMVWVYIIIGVIFLLTAMGLLRFGIFRLSARTDDNGTEGDGRLFQNPI